MKTNFTLLFFTLMTWVGFSQSFKLIEPGQTTNLDGQTVVEAGMQSSSTLEVPIYVINTSGVATDVQVKRYQLFAAGGTKHVACWYICPTEDFIDNYPYVDMLRDDAGNILEATIDAGDTNTTFFAKHYPEGISSCALYKYVFINRADANDTASVYIRFTHGEDACFLSDEEFNDEYQQLDLNIYPNPASDVLTIDLLKTIATSAEIKITNVLGKTVYNRVIDAGVDQLDVPLVNIDNGLYFITLYQNGKAVQTKKVQVVK